MNNNPYSQVIKDTESLRKLELRMFRQITTLLEIAGKDKGLTPRLINAVDRNRTMWLTLVSDLADDKNQLPNDLKAKLISIGFWVVRHPSDVLRGQETVDELIEVNRSIM